MTSDEKTIETMIKALPENFRGEVVDFIDFLIFKSHSEEVGKREGPAAPSRKLDPDKDPLLRLLGIADVEPFADHIDDELYGKRNESLH